MQIADMHCDTISELFRGADTSLRKNNLHIDIEKLKKGQYLIQNFAMFVYQTPGEDPLERCMKLIDRFYQEMEQNADSIAPVRSYQDILDNQRQGKLSAMLTVEEGAVIKGDLAILRDLYRLGVRMLTITWNFRNELGNGNLTHYDPSGEFDTSIPNTTDGLTEAGIEAVQEMERLGMVIDVSHLSDAGFYDVLKYTSGPFVASHSNARSICGHVRNLTDDMIRKLADRGGVAGINFGGNFLTDGPYGNRSTVEAMVCHIQHIVSVGGEDCVGLGTDFDGIPSNNEIENAGEMQMLVRALEAAGFSERMVEKICCQNVLRLYKTVLK